MVSSHRTVSKEDWVKARKALMEKEKELTRHRDEVSTARRDLPWVMVEDDYTFEGENGKIHLADLFGDKSQLIIQHFMFGVDWEEGCPSCSYMADSHNGTGVHMNARDINMVAVSNGPLDKILAYKKRMGWDFDWYSSMGTNFNYDFDVSFTDEDIENGKGNYNYRPRQAPVKELPGVSCFYKDEDGTLYHTYSTFARGLDALIGAYQYIDLTAKGRDEESLDFPMAWIRRHDKYE